MTHTRRKLDGAKLRELRQDRYALSQVGLARAVGVTRKTVARWENGEFQPSYAKLLELARVLRLPLDAFSTRELVKQAKDAA
jgi:transcriptional regulator with XRE-family HTH domain